MAVIQAIIPAAGLGMRFFPATKVIPKEMLPLIDKPSIQYAVEETLRSGIKNIVMVVNKNKKSIEDHFEVQSELHQLLTSNGKPIPPDPFDRLLEGTSLAYVRQAEPRGLGHAVWMARHVIGKEPVAILLPDDVIIGPQPGIGQLIKVAMQEKCSVIAVQEIPMEQVSRYGIIDIKKQLTPSLFQVRSVVEKPSLMEAPSNLAIVGRYVLSPHIFRALEDVTPGTNGEIQLTDGIQNLLYGGEKVFACKIQGDRYDTGTPMEWIKANIAFCLRHSQHSDEMTAFLSELDRDLLVIEGKARAALKQRML